MTWTSAIPYEGLRRDGRAVTRVGKKQIALFAAGDVIYACNNRCPHEGYPLREGSLADGCILTCNWHNWKFDLQTGDTLLGGDRLRVYPVKVEDGQVWVDINDPPAAESEARALGNLREAFADHEYDRIARELTRLAKSGCEPMRAVREAIWWSHDRLELGTTHAYAATAGWLHLHDLSESAETRLVCLLESIGHMAFDSLRQPVFAFTPEHAEFRADAFLAAIEAQDENRAIAMVRGALAADRHYSDLEHALTAAALDHYADFGHALIYVLHTGRLIARLGPSVELPLLLALVRSLVNATREDLIPEFRGYARALARWPEGLARSSGHVVSLEDLTGRSLGATLDRVVAAAETTAPLDLHAALLGANAFNLLHCDLAYEARTDGPVSQNVGWLDFTHAITFANAVRVQCLKFPDLWPEGLLQMGCFLGRNSGLIDRTVALEPWRVRDRDAFARASLEQVFDHGLAEYILSTHLLKTFLAAQEEVDAGAPPAVADLVLAAVNRYFHSPIKRRHVRRTAHQALSFVALED